MTGVTETPTWQQKKTTTRCVSKVELLLWSFIQLLRFLFDKCLYHESHCILMFSLFLFILNLQALMRELEHREKKVNDIQTMGDKYIKDGHPGKKTVEVMTITSLF